ncbi:hypothetical protein QQF64_019468 [Cirrhinus molitorella]|uniref:Uncharacterized protein n=1 Tax=Cirrhinus molitorella TaxID=172907 RepID=A0ABR3LFI2_9TELE
MSPVSKSSAELVFYSSTKRATTTALHLDILLSWITVRISVLLDWSVFMENGEMGSRVSADDDGDFQRIVDRSGRAHISTALHQNRRFNEAERTPQMLNNSSASVEQDCVPLSSTVL